MIKPFLPTVAIAAALALSCAPSVAQCQFSWLPGAPTSGPNGSVFAMLRQGNGDILAGGDFTLADDQFAQGMARFDGTSWHRLGQGIDGVAYAVTELPNGTIVVGGTFAMAGGSPANNIAAWNGTSWSPLGTGVNGTVTKLAEAPNGDIIVAGSFSQAGGTPANRIARWNGQTWSTVGGGPGITATQLAVTSNGDIFAAQGALLRRFDGLNWSTLAPSAPTILAATFSLAALPNGSLSIGGFFIGAGGIPGVTGAMLYQNGSFSPLPGLPVTGLPGSRQFVTSEGDLIINFFASMHRWNGSTWTELPGLSTGPLAELPNGELIACSPATPPLGHTQSSFAYRLRNGAWEQFANVGAGAARIAVADDGDLFVGGPMTTVDGEISVGFGHALPSCRATAVSAGAGCVGGAGPVTLQSNNLPWSGGVYRATADGMTAQSLALQLFGVQSTAQSLPLGAPGCSLLTVPFLTTLEVPSNGSAAMTFELPSNAIMIGQQLRQQVVGFELGGAGIVRLTSSNALDLVIGAL